MLRKIVFWTLVLAAVATLTAIITHHYDQRARKARSVAAREMLTERRAESEQERQRQREQELRQMSVSQLNPAAIVSSVQFPREWTYNIPMLPASGEDILAQLNIDLNIQLPELEPTPWLEEQLRAAADASFAKLGIANESVRGWELEIQFSPDLTSASTEFVPKRRKMVMRINPFIVPAVGPHEMTHVLMGEVTEMNLLPRVITEFVCNAAVDDSMMDGPFPFTYEKLNRPILGTGLMADGTADMIGVGTGSAFDGLRYNLLTAAGHKIGSESWQRLSRELYDDAVASPVPLTLVDVKPRFDQHGLDDCVLFQRTTDQGTFVDLAWDNNNVPLILYKQIDANGMESMLQVGVNFMWKVRGKPYSWGNFPTDPGGVFADPAWKYTAAVTDELQVTVGEHVYSFTIK